MAPQSRAYAHCCVMLVLRNAKWRKSRMEDKLTVEQWLAIRKEAALHIDPQTAEVYFHWGYILDPYGLGFDIPEEAQCVGRLYFARASGSEMWVSFYDLPAAIRDALWEKIDRQAAA